MKHLKKLLALSVCALSVLTLCSCNEMYDYFFVNEEGGFVNNLNNIFEQFQDSGKEVSYKEPPKIEVSNYYTASYDSPVERNLTDKEIEIYNLICYYIEDYQLDFHFEQVEEDTVINAYTAVINDHPEYFWLNKGYNYTKKTLGEHIEINFRPTSNGTGNEIASKEGKFKLKVQDIVREARNQESLYDKVLYVHDYIVDNTSYDKEAAENIDKKTDEYFDSRTAYGCLVNGKAVCSGYSAAFQYIMQQLEIPCGRMTGKSVDSGELHEWNYITLGDYNYQIDVTWDDTILTNSDGEKTEKKSYDYFLITTSEAEITHEIDKDQVIPSCSGLEYNYYIYNNLYFDKYDFEYAAYVIREHIGEGSVSIKFATSDECDNAYNDLINNNRIFEISGVGRSINYMRSNNGLVLTISSVGE